jgi:acyl-CoA synthetase (NDP forming)
VPTIEDLPLGIDAAVLAVPEAVVADAVASCAARGIGGVVVFAAGFAETGAEGKAKQERIAAIARDGGLALNGPNCMGLTNFIDRVSFSFGVVETEVLAAGKEGAAIIAQSGAMTGNIASALGAKGVPVNYTISTGNEAVIGVEDFLEEVLEDADTRVIVLFMEQIRQPQRFLDLVARARHSGKPVLLMHPGSSERGRQSAHSHTGALAGNYAVMQAVTRHHGVVLVETVDELIDTAMLLRRWPGGAERGAAVMSNSGAMRGIALDFGERLGLDIPKLSAATLAALRPIIPGYVPADNPLDLATAGMGQADIYGKTARIMLADESIGCAVLAMVPGTPLLQMAKGNSLVPLVASEPKPVAFVMMGDEVPLVDGFNQLIRDSRIPFFRSPDRAMRAMAHVFGYGKRLCALSAPHHPARMPVNPLPGTGVIPEHRAKTFLRACGIPVPPGGLAKSVAEARAIAARIGFPVAMKIQSAAIPHKSDIGGVAKGILDDAMVHEAWDTLHDKVRRARPELVLDGILVETLYASGTEMIIGARHDPDWGPIVLVGLGGVWTEALNDIQILPAGLSAVEIRDEIVRLKAAPLFAGLRGWPALDLDEPARIAASLGELMLATPEIEEIEINPLALRAAGQGAIALDALMVVRAGKTP